MLEILGSCYSDPENVCFPAFAFARAGEECNEQLPSGNVMSVDARHWPNSEWSGTSQDFAGSPAVHHRTLGLGAEAKVRLRARGETATTGGAA